jgi:hypothetical protein
MSNIGLDLSANSGILHSIWGSGTNNIYAVGYGVTAGVNYPLIYEKTTGAWQEVDQDWPSGTLEAVWTSGPGDVHVVGHGSSGGANRPLLYHLVGTNWTSSDPTFPSGVTAGWLYGVWGFSTSSVYAVGKGTAGTNTVPLLYNYNGSSWSTRALDVTFQHNILMDVWGTATNNIYAVGFGNNGVLPEPLIYHTTNGTDWDAQNVLPVGWQSAELYGVWGSSATNVYAVGGGTNGNGEILPLVYHTSDGTDWTWTVPTLPYSWDAARLHSIWGASAGEIYIAGYNPNSILPVLYRRTSRGDWAPSIPKPSGWEAGKLNDLWGPGTKNLFVVGSGYSSGSSEQPLLSDAASDTVWPGPVTDLSAEPGTSTGSVDLSWTAPADDENKTHTGPVERYKVIYSKSALTDCNSGTEAPNPPVPAPPGYPQTMTVTGLEEGQLYNFSVCTWDEEDNPKTIPGMFGTPASAMGRDLDLGIFDDTDPKWS